MLLSLPARERFWTMKYSPSGEAFAAPITTVPAAEAAAAGRVSAVAWAAVTRCGVIHPSTHFEYPLWSPRSPAITSMLPIPPLGPTSPS